MRQILTLTGPFVVRQPMTGVPQVQLSPTGWVPHMPVIRPQGLQPFLNLFHSVATEQARAAAGKQKP